VQPILKDREWFGQGIHRATGTCKKLYTIPWFYQGIVYDPLVRSSVVDVMPAKVRRSLAKFGSDLSIARRQRRLTAATMCERVGVSKATWQRMEKGDPTVSLAAYAQALFVLGFGAPFGDLIDQRNDERALLLSAERLPRRVASPGRRGQRARKNAPRAVDDEEETS
jgi:transcriptional regulator with XRE-family HTH domain